VARICKNLAVIFSMTKSKL